VTPRRGWSILSPRHASRRHHLLLFDRNLAGVFRSARDGLMLECNDAFARIHALPSREAVLGRSARDFYVDPAERDELLARLDEDRRVVNRERHARRANGEEFWALVSIAKVNDGTSVGHIELEVARTSCSPTRRGPRAVRRGAPALRAARAR